jgi:tetratricopeptide (TPR) repeat protein
MLFTYRRPGPVIILLVFALYFSILPAGRATGQSREDAPPPAKQTPPPKPPPPDPKARQQAYLRYLEARDFLSARPPLTNEAIAAYRDVIRLDPTAAEAHADLGEVYLFYIGRFDDAEHEGLEAIRLDPDSLTGHKLLARLYMVAVRVEKDTRPVLLERAIREYEQVTRLDEGNAEAWAFLADLYQTKNNPAKQLQALERWAAAPVSGDLNFYGRLTNSELSAGQAYARLSQLYLEQGKYQQAIETARRAYEAEPESVDYVSNLMRMLRYSATIEDELKIYAQLGRTAESPALMIGFGATLLRAGKYAEAIERLRQSVKNDPTNASAVGLLAIAQRRAGQRREAVETLKQAIARTEESLRPKLRLDLAETYEELGRHDDALAQYESLFESLLERDHPDLPTTNLFGEVMSRMVKLYARVNDLQKLRSTYARAQKLLGENSPVLDSINIETLREEGKRVEALELTRAAARRYPEDHSFRFTEALLLSETGNHRESAELLRGMISERPEQTVEDANVYQLLSSVQLQSGQLKEAEASVRRAIKLNPDNDGLLIQLSLIQDKAGEPGKSEKILRELLQRDPENASALNSLGYFLLRRGEKLPEAVRLIERAVNIEPVNGNFLDSLGWANYKLGRLEEARRQLEKARMYARRNPTVYEHLGDVLRDSGHVPEARRQWEKALQLSIEAQEIARLKDKLKIALH